MVLSREDIKKALTRWNLAWGKHDLDGVMELFHDEVLFDNWTGGQVKGKENLRKAWASWFANHGGFRFAEEETFIDEEEQKALYRWQLDWPSFERDYEGRPEMRRGVDVLHFRDGKIIQKLTYSKTTIEIDGERVRLSAGGKEPKRPDSQKGPWLQHDLIFSEDGVDLTLIRWMLSMTPTERLQTLQQNIRSIMRLRDDKANT